MKLELRSELIKIVFKGRYWNIPPKSALGSRRYHEEASPASSLDLDQRRGVHAAVLGRT